MSAPDCDSVKLGIEAAAPATPDVIEEAQEWRNRRSTTDPDVWRSMAVDLVPKLASHA